MKLSIIIVDYRSKAATQRLVASLPHRKDWEVIVVDNNTHNRGYGGGLNYGATQSRGEYLLFLNPDISLTPAAIITMLHYLENHPKVGAVGPQVRDAQGQIVPSCFGPLTSVGAMVAFSFLNTLVPHNRWSRAFWLTDWDRQTTRRVSVINGACMLVRRADFTQTGGFDESFFLYFEENDLCRRLQLLGKQIVFLTTAVVVHERKIDARGGYGYRSHFSAEQASLLA